MRLIIIFLVVMTVGCNPAKKEATVSDSIVDVKDFWKPYQQILTQHLKEKEFTSENGDFFHNEFDYKSLKESADGQVLLAKQIENLKTAEIPDLKDAKLAFWINAYNFFTLVDVNNNYPLKSMKDIGWKTVHHKVSGTLYSLDQIEHEIIRPLGEPLIHFAINCAALSCPTLDKDIFEETNIKNQLVSLAKNALKNPMHLRMDGDELLASKILEWFSEDFEISPYEDIDGFVKKFAPEPLKQDISDWIDYQWGLNSLGKINSVLEKLGAKSK